jgi:hypothetical protein
MRRFSLYITDRQDNVDSFLHNIITPRVIYFQRLSAENMEFRTDLGLRPLVGINWIKKKEASVVPAEFADVITTFVAAFLGSLRSDRTFAMSTGHP